MIQVLVSLLICMGLEVLVVTALSLSETHEINSVRRLGTKIGQDKAIFESLLSLMRKTEMKLIGGLN